MFELHPQLAQDCFFVAKLPLCRLLLVNDANYPWFVLVPERKGIEEIYQLSENDQQQLLLESCVLAEVMQQVFNAKKMNVAALGNMVPQLHLHHIARYEHDKAWPGPVWGKAPAEAYDIQFSKERMGLVLNGLQQKGLLSEQRR